jgi:integrase/recombinase XerD
MNNTFISNIAQSLADFLSFKNALGIEYKTSQVYLRQLDIYNYGHGNFSTLTKEVAEGWAMQHANKSTSRDRSWIPPIREFGRYLRSIGDNNAYVLDSRFTIQHYHAEVYLMTDDEIQSFLRNATCMSLNIKLWEDPMFFLHYTDSYTAVGRGVLRQGI